MALIITPNCFPKVYKGHIHLALLSCREIITHIRSRKLTWNPKKGSIKTTVLLKGVYMGFHVSLGECTSTTVVGLCYAVPWLL